MLKRAVLLSAILSGGVLAGNVQAGAIISATSATIDAGGPGSGSINDTFNQAGLLTGYTPGATDFDAYIAGNPLHNLVFAGNEWFSNNGNTAQVTYNLGSVKTIDGIALWGEDISGIGLLNLLTSTDGVNFAPLLSNLSPVNNADNVNYGAEVFSFGAVGAQYVRFDMSRCPQTPGNFNACAIGEVAFRQTADIPAPGVLGLLGLGIAGLAALRRKAA